MILQMKQTAPRVASGLANGNVNVGNLDLANPA